MCAATERDADGFCHVCGGGFALSGGGIAGHRDADGEPDFAADSDHVPFQLD